MEEGGTTAAQKSGKLAWGASGSFNKDRTSELYLKIFRQIFQANNKLREDSEFSKCGPQFPGGEQDPFQETHIVKITFLITLM